MRRRETRARHGGPASPSTATDDAAADCRRFNINNPFAGVKSEPFPVVLKRAAG